MRTELAGENGPCRESNGKETCATEISDYPCKMRRIRDSFDAAASLTDAVTFTLSVATVPPFRPAPRPYNGASHTALRDRRLQSCNFTCSFFKGINFLRFFNLGKFMCVVFFKALRGGLVRRFPPAD